MFENVPLFSFYRGMYESSVMSTKDKVVIYGMAFELWGKEKVKSFIDEFIVFDSFVRFDIRLDFFESINDVVKLLPDRVRP